MRAIRVLAAVALCATIAVAEEVPMSFFDLTARTLEGTPQPLAAYRGQVVLVVNTASECGFTPQYGGLEKLYDEYKGKGFTVLGLATDNKENKDSVETVKAYVSIAKIKYPVGFVTTEIVAYYIDSHDTGVPQMVLFGPDGKMAKRLIGWNEKVGKEMRSAIEAQLAKMPTVKPGSKASSRPATQKIKQG